MNSQRFREDKVLEKKDLECNNNQQDKQLALMILMDNTHLLHRENIRRLKHHHTLDVNHRTHHTQEGNNEQGKEFVSVQWIESDQNNDDPVRTFP